MSIRNRPTLDRRHRPRWQDELRSQQLIVAGFAVAIAVALGIFAATAWSSFYDNHLREIAFVAGQGLDRDALNKREGILTAELQAKGQDLVNSEGGAHNSVIQQQLQVIQETLSNAESTASDSLTTGAFMRADAPRLGVTVSDDAISKEVTRRSTLPFQLQLSVISISALPDNAAAGTKPTAGQLKAAKIKANDLLALLKKGADFGKTAKERSADDTTKALNGLIGWIQAGDAVYGTFFDAAKSSKQGDLVGPIKGDAGYAILKVNKVREAKQDPVLKDLLSAVHASDADYREYIRDELLKTSFQTYFGDHVLSKYMPQRHVAQIQIPADSNPPLPQERIRHVLIQPLPGAEDQTKATQAQWMAALNEAKAVRAELVKPNADWKTIAKEHSDDPGSRDHGGDLGWYDPTTAQFVPEFKSAIQTLTLGKVSEPVKTQFGYHIIEVTDRRITAEERARKLDAELKAAPNTWDKVVTRESSDNDSIDKGGDIGWVARYEKDTTLEDAIFSLTKVGQISTAVKGTDGKWYIFKLLETSDARYVPEDRLSSIKTTGYDRWQGERKTQVGVWIDPQFQSTTAASG
jgi:parvulin-like peptidyl-prolyl isomerase